MGCPAGDRFRDGRCDDPVDPRKVQLFTGNQTIAGDIWSGLQPGPVAAHQDIDELRQVDSKFLFTEEIRGQAVKDAVNGNRFVVIVGPMRGAGGDGEGSDAASAGNRAGRRDPFGDSAMACVRQMAVIKS